MRGFAHVRWSVVGGIVVSAVYSELKVLLQSLTGPMSGLWGKETKCSFLMKRKRLVQTGHELDLLDGTL